VFTADDFRDELNDIYLHGLKPGYTIGDHLDNHLTFEPGRLYTVTGIPGHGKSEFLDFIIERLNAMHGMKAAYFSPENHPIALHVSKLIEKITGMKFTHEALDRDDYYEALDRVTHNFHFINPESYEMDNIIDKARYLVFRKGIKILVIDPWNKIEHHIPHGMSETNYVSKMLDKIITFARQRQVIVFLVAHPRKLNKIDKKYEVPTLYDISGSANFYNKTDFGFAVYRDFQQKVVSVHIQKVKFKHLGSEGVIGYKYEYGSGRFTPHSLDGNYTTTEEQDEDERLPF
jgi:twinkle protein